MTNCKTLAFTSEVKRKSLESVKNLGDPSLFFKVLGLAYGLTYGRTDSNVTTRIFEIDELPNFLKYGAPLAFGAQELR